MVVELGQSVDLVLLKQDVEERNIPIKYIHLRMIVLPTLNELVRKYVLFG